MGKQIAVYLILLLIFTCGSIYNFTIRKQCTYPIRLMRSRAIIILIASVIFLGMAYFVSDGSWYNYILAILASIFITSSILGEGVHRKGIYFYPIGKKSFFSRLAKWQDVKDVKLDTNKNKLESFKVKTTTIFPNQYYSAEDIEEIDKYIKMKIQND